MIKRIALTASLAVFAAAAHAQVQFLSFTDNGTTASTRVSTFVPASGGNPATSTSTYTSNSVAPYIQNNSTAAAAIADTRIIAPNAIDPQLSSLTYTFSRTLLGSGGAGSGDPEELNFTDGGTITVTDGTLGALFSVSFDSGELDATGFAASNDAGDNVVYTVINPAFAPYISPNGAKNAFAFSFANAKVTGSTITYSNNASFTTSPVPEPTTMAALGLGAVAMLRRRRKA